MPDSFTLPQTTDRGIRFDQLPHGVVYDWLAENGITEWLPEQTEFVVDAGAQTITYTAFLWIDGKRGFNPEYIHYDPDKGSPVERRTVPLRQPLTDRVREAITASNGVRLGEITLTER